MNDQRASIRHRWRRFSFFLMSLPAYLLSGCTYFGKVAPNIPTELIAASSTRGGDDSAKRLIIVLPGIGDDLAVMRKAGIVQAMHAAMPDADVLLVEMTYAYYDEGSAIARLHEEVVFPARQRGYREIILAGASLGGMGVLLYEHSYPRQVQHLVLMAPYMGDRSLLKEIDTAGGLSSWDPGTLPANPRQGSAGRVEWQLAKHWLQDRERAADVWLICGNSDRFIEAARKLQPVLPERNYVELKGGHKWTVWGAGAREVFGRIGR